MPTLDAPLCPASPRADAALRERLRAMTARCEEALGADLVAVVLGGSLARGEGMVLRQDDGPRVLSDIDLYVVRAPSRPDVERSLREEFEADLSREGLVSAPLDLAFVAPGYFATLGDSLPARQLAIATRILFELPGADWARPDVLAPPDAPVDPDDAHRLLLNRMAEAHLLSAEPDSWFHAVHRAKRWIDAPLAWLAAQGEYHPSRRVQLDRLEAMCRDGRIPSPDSLWVEEGIDVARRWLDTIATTELDPVELRTWPPGDSSLPLPEGVDRVRVWTWAFARSLFALRSDGAARHRERPFTGYSSGASEEWRVVGDWLRREPKSLRWRRARQWHPLAPVAVRPWWRYAGGGIGPERVYAASALLYAGRDDWDRPLHELLSHPERIREGGAPALGRLWADWILGGGRR